ncbi:UvrD-helicase domain-containing protein [Rubripirellula reticaptiva]|uniref:DNA 3'-5' helicase n=1 Tax=Rubripirellula reticaptiva TaxID=2528013 RepID=A0A5C6F3B0_9BACT|nr:UvrD-helicase domain-containing protein [Rubripirellula reticaptiva]TWU55625.1 ATP-dependent DNA helicase PcrA [Rubripirellula reticaptiva]
MNKVTDPMESPSDSSDVDAFTDGGLLPTLVRASAGTGKTYRLTARLLRILLQGASPETILATTFTRKAAGEILDRVLLTLARAADPDDPEALQSLRDQVGIATLPRSVCLQLIDTLLRNIHRLRICTMDSLFSQLARSFPFELGLPPAWRLTDEIEEAWLRERAVDSVISMLDRSEMTAVLSMLGKGDIKRSVARELLQVVDAAYSGQRLCNDDVWKQLKAPKLPESADVTRAAGIMRMAEPPQKRLRTKLDQFAEKLELRDFGSLVDDTLVANIGAARRSRTEVLYYRSPFPEGVDEAFDVVYAAAKSTVLALMNAQNEATATVIAAYDHHIGQLKHTARAVGFEDVAIRLAAEFSRLDQKSLALRMDGAVDHLLLDEFQDTSPVQWHVLRPFAARCAAPVDESAGKDAQREVPKSFFCVGDTKQAIYGWRGGVAEIFEAVADQISGITEVEQNQSFRSSPVVVEAVNDTFKNLQRHPICDAANSGDLTDKSMYEAVAVRDFAVRFPTHSTARMELPGHVRLETARQIEDGDASQRQLACFEDAARIAAEINAANPERSIGILTRTNRGVAQLIFMLEQMEVSVSQEGGNPLTDSAAVEMILSALMMAEHPGDGRWAFHVSSTPMAAIPGFGSDFVRSMCEDRGVAETVEFLAGTLAPLCDVRETLRLKQLVQLALGYEMNPAPRLRDFVRMVREKRVERPQAAAVRVMTVHQSKGLEFDAVILAELDGPLTRARTSCVPDIERAGDPPKGLSRYLGSKSWHYLPATWQRAFGMQAEGSMTEAMCLLYVAMTRARQSLRMVIQPPKKTAFENRTPSSLIYHALGCKEDPTQGETVLFESGDPAWMGEPSEPVAEKNPMEAPIAIKFRCD